MDGHDGGLQTGSDHSHLTLPLAERRKVGEVTLTYFDAALANGSFAELAKPVAECYREVYGYDRAWNEGKICKMCSLPGHPKKWNLALAPDRCDNCSGELEDRWPVETVINDMRDEFELPDAVCVTASIGDQVIGACWGFSASLPELEAHLNGNLPPEAQPTGVVGNITRHFDAITRVAYQDEIFLQHEFHGRGIGKMMFAMRLAWFVSRGLRVYVLRTKRNPPSSSYLWFHNCWDYKEVGSYPDADARVVLASEYSNVWPRVASLFS